MQAGAGEGYVNLSWVAPAGDGTFNLYRGTSSGGETLLASGIMATNYTDAAMTNGVTYFYFVTAMNPTLGSESPPSAVDSIGGYNGTYSSAVTLGVAGPQPPDFLGFEVTNTAAEFANGLNYSWITIPALNLNTDTVSFTAWLYPIGIQAPYTGLIFYRTGSTVAGMNYDGSGTDMGYTWNNDSGSWGWSSGLEPPQNQWSFVAVVVQPSNTVVYLINTNGAQSATNYLSQPDQAFAGTDTYSSAARVFNGVMDEVAVFNDALTPEQIGQLYADGHQLSQVQIGLQTAGAGLNLTWPQGTLLEATNLTGPWSAVT